MVTTEPNLKKKFTQGNGRKPAFIFYPDVTKIQKTGVVQALPASHHVRMCTVAENLRLSLSKHGSFFFLMSDKSPSQLSPFLIVQGRISGLHLPDWQ